MAPRPSRDAFVALVLERWPAARARVADRGVMVAPAFAADAPFVVAFAQDHGLTAYAVPEEVRVFNFPRARRSS